MLHGRRYDVVHTASFPYFSLLAAGFARLPHRFRLVVDWHEVWTRAYWREYLGRIGGRIGWLVQKLCLRIPQRAFCFSRLHAARLRAEEVRGEVTTLEGQYQGPTEPAPPRPAEPVVVFAGRLIPEKQVDALIPALARARREIPGLRGEVFGDGPDRQKALDLIAAHGLDGAVEAPGFVDGERVDAALARALCLVVPSRREGYGLVVLEAAAKGTPAVVVTAPDNAATELVADGESGVIARSALPEDLAEAIVEVHRRGDALRQSTATWFRRNSSRFALASSLKTVLAAYGEIAVESNA
jgi:glycosyltransferase involved in cell wall biosynthesis